jgi:hypothetical protein
LANASPIADRELTLTSDPTLDPNTGRLKPTRRARIVDPEKQREEATDSAYAAIRGQNIARYRPSRGDFLAIIGR